MTQGLTFGCVPDTADDTTVSLLQDLCGTLGRSLGRHVDLFVAAAPKELARGLADGTIDIAWVSPTLLVTSRELEQAVPLVQSTRQGVMAFHGVLFVSADSDFCSVTDLMGADAAWVAPTSASGFIFPRLALGTYGIDPRTLFGSEAFHGSHGNVARAVLAGEADVGGTYAVFEHANPTGKLLRAGFLEAVAGREGRVLLATAAIPSDLIVARSALPEELRRLVKDALEALDRDPMAIAPVREVLGADAFRSVEPRRAPNPARTGRWGRQLGLIRP